MTTFLDSIQSPCQTISGSGAQASTVSGGTIVLTSATATNLTIPAPKAGGPRTPGQPVPSPTAISNENGQDGQELSIMSTTAAAHTVTAGNNKINGNKTTATFAAAIGNNLKLKAYGGVWYQQPSSGITLS